MPQSQPAVNCCIGCERPIVDKYYTCIDNQTWHQDCLRCVVCRVQLIGRCFVRNGQHFCRNDFLRLFSPRCPTCLETILPAEMVRFFGSVAYHAECFRCVLCARCLSTGDECRVLGDGVRFVCVEHEISMPPPSPFLLSGSPPRSEDVFEPNAELKNEPRESFKDVSSYRHTQDSYPSIGPIEDPGEADQERAESSPLYNPSHLEGDDQSEGEIEGGSKGASGGDEASGSPGSNDMSASGGAVGNMSTGAAAGADNSNGQSSIDGGASGGGSGALLTKRRGPRTTIKAKQLDTLKQAFASTPKPTRHIREQLAQETGLSMRVIQVWFQNRRSKERRMKQLSAMGVRKPFFQQQQHHNHHAGSRRMRGACETPLDPSVFPPNDLPPELMAELLRMPQLPPQPPPPPHQHHQPPSSTYQPGGMFCGDSQSDFYMAVAAATTGQVAMRGAPMYTYGSAGSPPAPLPQPPFQGYQPPFVSSALSPPPQLTCEGEMGKTVEDQINESSVYYSDGGSYTVDKGSLSPLPESVTQLTEGRFIQGSVTFLSPPKDQEPQETFHHHVSHSTNHLSPIKTQKVPSDHLNSNGVLECSW